jgi:hypothetical protein
VRSLYSRALLLSRGNLALDSSVADVAETYLESFSHAQQTSWSSTTGLGDEDAVLNSMRIYPGHGTEAFFSSDQLLVELIVTVIRPKSGLCIGFDLLADDGSVILRAYDIDDSEEAGRTRQAGVHRVVGTINARLLHGRRYGFAPRIGVHNQKWIVNCDPLLFADVILDHGDSPYWASLGTVHRPGLIAPALHWHSEVLSNEAAALSA